jgi:predicted esterase
VNGRAGQANAIFPEKTKQGTGNMRKKLGLLAVLVGLFLAPVAAQASKEVAVKGKDGGLDYYLYLPDRLEPGKRYWLFVAAHVFHGNGKGAAGMVKWADRGDCIVLAPSFPDGFQGLAFDSDKRLLDIVDALKAQYNVHDHIFLYGFSAGAQFAHRFGIAHPDRVCGVAAHSAGTWATGGNWMALPETPLPFPIVITCGLADTGKSMPDQPNGRLDWCREFEKQLKARKCLYKAVYIPNAGHQLTRQALALTEECFLLATSGLVERERAAVRLDMENVRRAAAKKDPKAAESPAAKRLLAYKVSPNGQAGWNDNAEVRQAAFKALVDEVLAAPVPAAPPPVDKTKAAL